MSILLGAASSQTIELRSLQTSDLLGNHEFNYGPEYLDRVLKSSPIPGVSLLVTSSTIPRRRCLLPRRCCGRGRMGS